MFVLPRFFYADDQGNNGAGGGGTPNSTSEGSTSTIPVATSPIISEDEMKGFGFDSPDALKEFLKNKKEGDVSDEEKKKREGQDKANLIKFATDNGIAQPEDFTRFDNLTTKADRDLVYEQFAAQFKDENPEISSEELEAETRTAFESEYKLNSVNPKTKERGEKRLAKEAGDLRLPVTNKITKAQTEFKEEKTMREKMPAYNKFIDDLVTEVVPEKLVVYKGKEGEEDITVDITLTEDERKEISKVFKNEKTFFGYHNSTDLAALKSKISKKIDGFLKAKKFDAAISEVYIKGKGAGTKQGSTTGADNPFALQQGGSSSSAAAAVTDDTRSAQRANEKANSYRNR